MEKEAGVLIVEDSDEVLWMIDKVLESGGLKADGVTSGQEAIQKVRESPKIRLIILNYLLPDMSGLSVLEQLRQEGFKGEVIGISALKEAGDIFMGAGAFAFLEKPFDIKELIGLCKQALSASNA